MTHTRKLLGLCVVTCILFVSGPGHAAPMTPLLEWPTEASEARLSRSTHKADFFPLSNHFLSQDNKIFCGPVSAAIVLNALRLRRRPALPLDTHSLARDELAWLSDKFNPFLRKYTPHNVLTRDTKTRMEVMGKPIEIKGELKRDFGLQLRQLAQVFRAHQALVTIRVVDDDRPGDAIKRELAQNLATPHNFVVVNYARRALGQSGGGHISPLAAYDERSDSFLIMDVNPNRAPWVWVHSADLIAAMRTFDTVENRGYLLISDTAVPAESK